MNRTCFQKSIWFTFFVGFILSGCHLDKDVQFDKDDQSDIGCQFDQGCQGGKEDTLVEPLDEKLLSLTKDNYGSDSVEELEQLLMQGANPNAQDEQGNTSVHYATQNIQAKNLEVLIRYEGSLRVQNNSGKTPLMLFTEIRFFGFGTPRYVVYAYNDLKTFVLHLLDSTDKETLGLDIQDKQGKTLLMALANDFECILKVLQAGANTDLQDNNGNTAAMLLVSSQVPIWEEILQSLLYYGADMLIVNADSETVLSIVPNDISKTVYEIILKERGKDYADSVLMLGAVIQTKRNDDEELSIIIASSDHDTSCYILSQLALNLQSWKTRVTQSTPVQLPNCECEQNTCSIPLKEIAPSFMLDMESNTLPNSGPNCFNSALIGNANQAHFRHVGRTELEGYIDSGICRERQADETHQAGDIVIVYYEPVSVGDILPSPGPIHAFAYISEEHSFSKDGFNKTVPYLLTSNAEVYRKYRVIKKLQGVTQSFMETYTPTNGDEIRRNQGYNYAIYYDCTPGEKIESVYFENVDPRLVQINQDLYSLEQDISGTLMTSEPTQDLLTEWSENLQSIKIELDALSFTDNENQLAWDHLEAKVESLEDQLTIL